MNALPKQVQQQADEMARMDAAMEAQLLADSQPPPVADTPAEESQPEPVQQVEAAPAPTPTPETTWEARYRSLKGKYDAEIPRLHTQIRELTTKVDGLTEKPKKAAPAEKLVTEADVDAFGSDLIDVIDRKAREVARTMAAELEAENAQLKERLGDVAEKQSSNDRRTYFSDLAKVVPDYEALNVSEEFLDWLDEVDPMSGYPRQAYLNDAFEKLDVGRTAHVFNAFKGLKPPAPPVKSQRQELERQVAPDKTGSSSAAPSESQSRVWSNDEISRFYLDSSKGRYRDNPAEQARIEAEIDQAVMDGRIR